MGIVFENRAWKGVRLVSTPLRRGSEEYSFEVGVHYVRRRFYVEVYVTHLDREPPETYGGIDFFGDTVQECLDWVKENFKVDVSVEDPYELRDQERYEFTEYGIGKG